jgi:acyl-CoA synthetase (NDP forming)
MESWSRREILHQCSYLGISAILKRKRKWRGEEMSSIQYRECRAANEKENGRVITPNCRTPKNTIQYRLVRKPEARHREMLPGALMCVGVPGIQEL